MYKEKIVDALTGEETWRDYTEAEIAEVEAAQALVEKKRLEAEEKEAARKELLTKLGISDDEAKLLLS
jgi:hypothetical protein